MCVLFCDDSDYDDDDDDDDDDGYDEIICTPIIIAIITENILETPTQLSALAGI